MHEKRGVEKEKQGEKGRDDLSKELRILPWTHIKILLFSWNPRVSLSGLPATFSFMLPLNISFVHPTTSFLKVAAPWYCYTVRSSNAQGWRALCLLVKGDLKQDRTNTYISHSQPGCRYSVANKWDYNNSDPGQKKVPLPCSNLTKMFFISACEN